MDIEDVQAGLAERWHGGVGKLAMLLSPFLVGVTLCRLVDLFDVPGSSRVCNLHLDQQHVD